MAMLRGFRCSPLLVVTMFFPLLTEGSELTVSYAALERNIVLQIMTDGGRYYLQGDRSTPCRSAFVQEPRVDAVRERLRIRLLFSGRTGTSVGGQCVGTGDNFDLEITGVPAFSNGELYLSDTKMRADAAYFNVVSKLIESRLSERLRFPVQQQLEQAAAWMSTAGRGSVTLEPVAVHAVTVEAHTLRFSYDLSSSIGP